MCWHAATFAGYTGTAPIEAFSGDVVRHRLSRAGDRQPNCALHTMAITQIGRDTPGRALLPNGNAPPERVTGKRCAAGRGGSRTSPVGSFSATRRQSWRQTREDTWGRLYRPARQADTPHTGPVTSLTHQIPPYNRSHRFGFDTESGTTSSGSRTASADPHALGPMSDQLPARCPERLGRCRSRAAPADDGVPRLGVAGLRRPGRRQLLAHQVGTATQTRGALGDGSRPGNLDRSCSFVVLILSSRAAGRSFSGDTDPASSDSGATHL